jgi:hypothetical protein
MAVLFAHSRNRSRNRHHRPNNPPKLPLRKRHRTPRSLPLRKTHPTSTLRRAFCYSLAMVTHHHTARPSILSYPTVILHAYVRISLCKVYRAKTEPTAPSCTSQRSASSIKRTVLISTHGSRTPRPSNSTLLHQPLQVIPPCRSKLCSPPANYVTHIQCMASY